MTNMENFNTMEMWEKEKCDMLDNIKENNILDLKETKLFTLTDYSDYYDFHLKQLDNNHYDLYILKSKYPLKGNGTYESSNEKGYNEKEYINHMINYIKEKHEIDNIIWKHLI